MRPNEFFNLKKKYINIKEKYIIGGGKTAAGTNRLIPIPSAVFPYILKWYLGTNKMMIFYYKLLEGNNWI